MRLLLDSNFPNDVPKDNVTSVELRRYEARDPTDAGFLQYGQDHGFAAVCLLGRSSLADADLLSEALRRKVRVVVVSEEDPVVGGRHLLDRLDQIVTELSSAQVLIVTGSRAMPAEQFQST